MATETGKNEDAQEIVAVYDAGQDHEAETSFDYDDDAINLVTEFKKNRQGKFALKRIVDKVLTEQDESFNATEPFRTGMAKTWALFAGKIDPKKDPMFKGMSNAHVPLLLENTIRMCYRQSYELFGNWTQVYGVTPIGPDDDRVAKLLTLHGNWQIRKRIKNFKREIGHRGLLIFNLFGDFIVDSYWDPVKRSNVHEVLTADDFGCAYQHVSTMPDLSDVPWRWKFMHMNAHDLRQRADVWEDVETVLDAIPPAWSSEIESILGETVNRILGVDKTTYSRGQYTLIQYEGWLNLPGQTKDRFCRVIVDKATRTPVFLDIYERPDPFDKKRFELQTKQHQEWMGQMQQYQEVLLLQEQVQQEAMAAAMTSPNVGEGATQGVMMARQLEGMPPPEPPMMPAWMENDPERQPEPVLYTPIHMKTHFVNIEPIMGIFGMGIGAIHAVQNMSADSMLQAFFDQAWFANFPTFLARGDISFENGKLEIKPGVINKILGGSEDISKDVIPFKFGEANPQLLTGVEMMSDFASRASNTPEVLSGEPGKSGETAQGHASRLEQATKMMSVPTGKYADGVTQVLINNATLNSLFMPEEEFFFVNNHDPLVGQLGWQNFSVLREMYDRPFDVEISADLKFISNSQRIQEADSLVQLHQAVPALAGNLAFQYQTIVKSLEARNRFDLIPLLGAAPPVPQMFGMPSIPQPQPVVSEGQQSPGGGGQQPAQGPAGPAQRGTPSNG